MVRANLLQNRGPVRDPAGQSEAFAKHGINLTKIESRPSRQKAWEYVFFIDFMGHQQQPRAKRALDQLAKSCVFLKVLGSYPRSL